ncbi:MAG TPA: CBS domain-containing protein [Candidatus Bathyarchaeia archaeon]|nr:CBS domain-containing protein [Candidatus Bathyarchaeia archaeon]
MLKYEELKAKDLIKQAIILEPNQTLYDVRSTMIRYNISRLVIAKDNKPLGIITEKDIARFLYNEVPNRRLNEVPVNEIMSTELIKIEQQTNLDICARTMLEKEISSIVVVDDEGDLKGIITKSDMVEAYARHYPSKLKVEQYMTRKVITVAPDENLHMILLLMSENQISRVIVTRDHKPIGIVTGHDLLPASILFGTGVPGGYWTSQEELVARRRAQRFIPAGIKAIFLAGDMMKYDPITIAKDADLIEASQMMVNHRISGLPVVESNSGTLAGIITKTDIVKGIACYSK